MHGRCMEGAWKVHGWVRVRRTHCSSTSCNLALAASSCSPMVCCSCSRFEASRYVDLGEGEGEGEGEGKGEGEEWGVGSGQG